MDTMSGQLVTMGAKIDSLETRVDTKLAKVDERLDKQDERMEALEAKLESKLIAMPTEFEAARNGYAGSRSNATFVPLNKRRTVFVGGFGKNALKAEVEAKLTEITAGVEGVSKIRVFGKLSESGKIDFVTSDDMWNFLKANKGIKFQFDGKDLFHKIDQTKEEVDLAKRTSKAVTLLKRFLTESMTKSEGEAKQLIQGDWDRGVVFYKPAQADARPVRLYDRVLGTSKLRVAEEAAGSGFGFDFQCNLTTINGAA